MLEHPCLSPRKGAIVGGAIVFAWSAISWMALPFHNKTVRRFTDSAAVVNAVSTNVQGSGVYIVPNDPKGQRAPTDPFVFLSFNTGGWGDMGKTMALGFLMDAIGAFFWTWILGKIPGLTVKDMATYGAMFGVCLGSLGFAPNSVWWKFPWDFTLMYLADAVIAWTIASIVIGKYCQAAACPLPNKG